MPRAVAEIVERDDGFYQRRSGGTVSELPDPRSAVTSTMDQTLVRVSKRLAWALRHDPEAAGLVLDGHGWVGVSDVLAALGVSREVLDAVVIGNDKQRFEIRRDENGDGDGTEYIRASQGHSVAVELGLDPVPPPATLFHGTPETNFNSIMSEGLRRGRRQHVHLSADPPTARTVGLRRRVPARLLAVDSGAMALAGHAFYRSANGVWLTEHVPPGHLSDADRR
jgi:putative RNA 2'-phosphotransferase